MPVPMPTASRMLWNVMGGAHRDRIACAAAIKQSTTELFFSRVRPSKACKIRTGCLPAGKLALVACAIRSTHLAEESTTAMFTSIDIRRPRAQMISSKSLPLASFSLGEGFKASPSASKSAFFSFQAEASRVSVVE